MDKVKRDTVLGIVFFAGLGLLLWATQELSGLTFEERQILTVEFKNARGLRTGEPVYVLGTQNGKVTTVSIQDRGDLVIQARIQLDKRVNLKDDTEVKVVDASMLGGKRVEITPGTTGVTVNTDQHVFTGIAPLGPLEAVGDLISGEDNKANLQGALAGLRDFMEKVNRSEGSIARLIKDDTLIKDAEAFVASLRRSAEEVEKKQSLLGKLVYDQELGKKLDTIAADIERVTTKLTKNEGTLGRLINDDDLGKKIDSIVANVDNVTAKLTTSESTLGRLINDRELGQRLDNVVTNFEKTTTRLNDKDSGLLGALLNDEVLLADARKIFKDFSEISDKVNNGEGALARLINDKDMARRLDSALRQVTRAIEDAREAAPVGTFFQVFSGAF